MATKLYLHNAANDQSGTYPSGEQSAQTPDWTTAGGATLRKMDTTIGTAQASLAGTTAAVTTLQRGLLGMWTSPPLAGAQTVGRPNLPVFNVADKESNNAANFWANSLNAYVWRPSTGAKVGTIVDGAAASKGGTEGGTSETVTHLTNLDPVAVSAADGDVIICESWGVHTQSMATAYTATLYYDGTTENTTEDASVSNHASYISFSETLTFKGSNVTVALTGEAATASAGTLSPSTAKALTGEAATTATGTLTASIDSNVSVALTGVSATTSTGTLVPSTSRALAGEAATVSPGTLAPASSKALVGEAVTASAGTLAPETSKSLTGAGATASAGTIAPDISKALTGESATTSTGTLTASVGGSDVSVALTGIAATTSTGTLAPALSKALNGVSSTVSTGTLVPLVEKALTGEAATVSTGTLAPSVSKALTGVSATTSTGTLTVVGSVTPQETTSGGARYFSYDPPAKKKKQRQKPEDLKKREEEKPVTLERAEESFAARMAELIASGLSSVDAEIKLLLEAAAIEEAMAEAIRLEDEDIAVLLLLAA